MVLGNHWGSYFEVQLCGVPCLISTHCGQELTINIYMRSVGVVAYLDCYVMFITH